MVTPTVVRDLFVRICDDLIREPQDLDRINTAIQRAISEAAETHSPWMNDLLDLKHRINTNFARRFKR